MPSHDHRWVGLTEDPLSAGEVHDWAVHPEAGAVVVFSGTVRDHAPGRPGVQRLEYEAYTEQIDPRMHALVDEMAARWPEVRRVVVLHRIGVCEVGEPTVLVAVSTPHRPEAFAAARFAIDALKASLPIWKREVWEGGEEWSPAATELVDASEVAGPEGAS